MYYAKEVDVFLKIILKSRRFKDLCFLRYFYLGGLNNGFYHYSKFSSILFR